MTYLSSTCIHTAVGPHWSLPYVSAAQLTSSAKYLTSWSRVCGGVAPWLPLGQKRRTWVAVLVAGPDNVACSCLFGHLALTQRRVLLYLHFRVGNGGDSSSLLSAVAAIMFIWFFILLSTAILHVLVSAMSFTHWCELLWCWRPHLSFPSCWSKRISICWVQIPSYNAVPYALLFLVMFVK